MPVNTEPYGALVPYGDPNWYRAYNRWARVKQCALTCHASPPAAISGTARQLRQTAGVLCRGSELYARGGAASSRLLQSAVERAPCRNRALPPAADTLRPSDDC